MSIGIVLKHTYEETCEVCDKIAQFVGKASKSFWMFCETIGYARAASYLASQGYYEQAKQMMIERDKLKDVKKN